jgi:hypothetical protein
MATFADDTPLFQSDFNTVDDFNRWTVVNSNGDDYTWTFYESSGHQTASVRWNDDKATDDWLISPAITAPADGMYKLTIVAKAGGSSKEKMDICEGSSASVTAMTTVLKSFTDWTTNDAYKSYSVLVALKAGEAKYIGFHAKSDPGQWRILLDEVSMTASSGKDVSAQEITAPVSGKDLTQETVKIKIKNTGIESVTSIPVGYSFNGGTAVSETYSGTLAPGAEAEYTFNTKADISKVRNTYTFKAWTAFEGDAMADNDTCTASVMNDGNATVPYTMGFEATDYEGSIKIYNVANDDGKWTMPIESGWFNLAHTGNGCLFYTYDKNNAADDWAILDPIEVEPGYYSLKFWYSSVNNHNERLNVFYGNGNTPADMKTKVVEYSPFNVEDYVESASVIHITEKQVIYFGFHAFSDADENDILVDDISFKKIEASDVDLSVSKIAYPEDFLRSFSSKDAVFSIESKGISDVKDATLTVTLDDKVVSTETITVKAQSTVTKTISNFTNELAPGKHSMKVEIAATGDGDLANNSVSKDFVVLEDAINYWNFENYSEVDGKKIFYRPSDLKYLNVDGGTLNTQVQELFPDSIGWGPMEIEQHAVFGECMLGATSFIDGVSQADRWCIFPKVKITGANAYFVWNANSLDANYKETYKIMISDSDDDPWSFSTVKTITNESTTSQIHGVDLSSYAGSNIYVAIRLVSRNCYILTVDNVGFYGDVEKIATGVNTVSTASKAQIIVNGGQVLGSNDVTMITVNDIGGRMVAKSASNKVDVSTLRPGIYIAVGTTNNGKVTYKFVLK